MFKKSAWRNAVSDTVSFHQDQALNTTIFLLKSYGPTGFLLREDGEARNVKVCLGDPHTCTCPVFTKEQEPCKHICWVLLRKFRLPREHEYSFQHGLVERQILELLHGLHQTKAQRMKNDASAAAGTLSQLVTGQEAGNVCRKVIEAQDVCPICQEDLLEKKQPVSYCRFGCGNNIHISCMKVWADQQKLADSEDMVKCPLCREDFISLRLLQVQAKNAANLFTTAESEKPERHLGVPCHSCRICPVTGKCFKCTVCSYYYLCEDCSKKGCHPWHQFALRTKRRGKWHLVEEDLTDERKEVPFQPTNDSIVPIAEDPLPKNVLGCLPSVRVRPGSRLLDDGKQCRICLQNFSLGQLVRILPCHHKFHMHCVDGILRKSNFCPLDGYVIYNPLTWTQSERKTSPKLALCLPSGCAKRAETNLEDLFVPGVALRATNPKTAPAHGSLSLKVLTGSSETLNIPQRLITNQLFGLCITTTDDTTTDEHNVSQKKKNPVFPESSSINDPNKYNSADRQNARSSKKTPAKCSTASPSMFVPVKKMREQQQVNLFVGLSRSEPGNRTTTSFPSRRIRLQPRPRSSVTSQDTNNKLTSELRMTGVLINKQH